MGLYDPIKINLRVIEGVEKYEEMGDSGYHIGGDDDGMRKAVPEGETWVGRVEKGFDFLGYRISPKGLSIALASWNRFTVKLHRLLEQGATPSRWRQYIQHWIRWATSGVSCDREALLLNIKHILNSRFHFNGFVWPD